MKYIWINPVTESMYRKPVLDGFLQKHGFTRVWCRTDWGREVKEKYRKMLDGCRDTVADARCPMACELVKSMAEDGVRAAGIEPILIHCAREISSREDLRNGEKIITTPCVSLADMGNSLRLPNTRFITWNALLKELGQRPEGKQLHASPIPPGFFAGMEERVQSLTGKEEIEAYMKSGRWKEVRLMEMLYCHKGCHNGDGVVMDET